MTPDGPSSSTPPPAVFDDVVLQTERLLLRPLRPTDESAITEAMQDESMHAFLPLPDPYTREDARAYIAEVSLANRRAGRALECGLEERSSGRLVGTAALFLPSGRSKGGEIGYAVYPAGRGHGYAAQASRALTAWGFALGLQRIEIKVAVRNVASLKTALAAGFRYEGVERASIGESHGPGDAAVFARLPHDSDDPIGAALPPLAVGGLTDGTVTVRTFLPSDADLLVTIERDPDVQQWSLFGLDESRLRAGAARSGLDWLVGPHFRMVVADASTGAGAGTLSLYAAGPPDTAAVGYALHPAYRGRGWMGRALRLLSDWAFAQAHLAVLELGTDVMNVASQRTALAGGFQPEGIARRRLRRRDGTYADEARFSAVNPSLG